MARGTVVSASNNEVEDVPTLGGELQGFRSGKAHHYTTICHSLEEYGGKCGTGSPQGRARIEVFLVEESATTD